MITYVKGDATRPEPVTSITVILNVVNDQGGWGKGFVLALSRAYRPPELAYRAWHRDGRDARGNSFALGQVQVVRADQFVYVANLLCQHGYKSASNPRPLDYTALDRALGALRTRLGNTSKDVSIHTPRIGAGLAGGDWATIEGLIAKHLADYPVTIYDL